MKTIWVKSADPYRDPYADSRQWTKQHFSECIAHQIEKFLKFSKLFWNFGWTRNLGPTSLGNVFSPLFGVLHWPPGIISWIANPLADLLSKLHKRSLFCLFRFVRCYLTVESIIVVRYLFLYAINQRILCCAQWLYYVSGKGLQSLQFYGLHDKRNACIMS